MTSDSSYMDDLPVHGLVPGPDQRDRFRNVHVATDFGDSYSFNLVLPSDWGSVKAPSAPDAKQVGDRFTAIGMFSPVDPPMPPIILSVGAQIAPANTTVAQQFVRYCQEQGFEILILRPQRYAAGLVVEGLALQNESPVGPIKMRMAMFEDGGRLFGISGMAPSALYPDYVRDLSLAMLSFELTRPYGSRMSLG